MGSLPIRCSGDAEASCPCEKDGEGKTVRGSLPRYLAPQSCLTVSLSLSPTCSSLAVSLLVSAPYYLLTVPPSLCPQICLPFIVSRGNGWGGGGAKQ